MNEALRSFVTSASFNLTLRRTHIEALVWLDHAINRGDAHDQAWRDATRKAAQEAAEVGLSLAEARRLKLVEFHYQAPPATPVAPSFWFVASGALIRRGLVAHDGVRARENDASYGDEYRITEAGRLVIGLLKEAGLYQESRAALFGEPAGDMAGASR